MKGGGRSICAVGGERRGWMNRGFRMGILWYAR